MWYENGILCEIKRLAQNILLAVYAVSIVTYELEFLRTTVDDGSQNQSFRKSYLVSKDLRLFVCLFSGVLILHGNNHKLPPLKDDGTVEKRNA